MAKVDPLRVQALQATHAIELLANKWRIPILHILRDGPLRTGAIQGAISEVSAKVLTQTLRGMERDGLLVRDVFDAVSKRVEYRLTPMGSSLIGPLGDLCRWAKTHEKDRDRARKRFDASALAKGAK